MCQHTQAFDWHPIWSICAEHQRLGLQVRAVVVGHQRGPQHIDPSSRVLVPGLNCARLPVRGGARPCYRRQAASTPPADCGLVWSAHAGALLSLLGTCYRTGCNRCALQWFQCAADCSGGCQFSQLYRVSLTPAALLLWCGTLIRGMLQHGRCVSSPLAAAVSTYGSSSRLPKHRSLATLQLRTRPVAAGL